MTSRFQTDSILRFHAGDGEDFDSWSRLQNLLKPEDQMDLNESELCKEISKNLSSQNRHLPDNLVIYSFKDSEYVPILHTANVVTTFECEGTAINLGTVEANAQIARGGVNMFHCTIDFANLLFNDFNDLLLENGIDASIADIQPVTETMTPDIEPIDDEENQEAEVEERENIDAGTKDELEFVSVGAADGQKKKLANQFNVCKREVLTYCNPTRAAVTQTVPPPRSQFEGNAVQWHIFESYNEDYARQKREKEKGMMRDKKIEIHKYAKIKCGSVEIKKNEESTQKYFNKCQILERMVNQNIFDEIAHDYRYWEDPSDDFRGDVGTLMPLWKFSYEKMKKMSVTDICLNTYYFDLFAVCFGSFELIKQVADGCVCLFSIKNPSFPQYRLTTKSGAMCCDIHKKYPYLIVIGQFDGNVCVYNLQTSTKDPVYHSQGVKVKHYGAVLEIKWGEDMSDGEKNFYSLSSDGRVFNWVLMRNNLTSTTINTLYQNDGPISGPDATSIKLKASGTCMAFHPTNKEIFLVGTEEGLIFKCSTAYSSKYLMVYQAHYLSVHRMDFNKFNANIFVSCSSDWLVKVWEDMRTDPLFIFDLGATVGDVKWAPYSSTVFAAVTTEGRVFVFDLNVNKYKAICCQQVVPRNKKKLTRIMFNNKLPFIIVGDDKGTSITLKLSPNLRLPCKPLEDQDLLDQQTLQIQKLDQLLWLVRELPEDLQTPEIEAAVELN